MVDNSDSLFEECVSPQYVEAYRDGDIRSLAHDDPYNFAFLNDLFTQQFYESLLEDAVPTFETSYPSRTGYEIPIYYEPFANERFVRLVYSSVFRQFLAALMGATSVARAKDKYPQLRAVRGADGAGMGIHDDGSAPYNGAIFFNLNQGWNDGDGGELVIWEKQSATEFKKRFQFPPRGNSMSAMWLSTESFHSVNKPNVEWDRVNVLMEVDFVSNGAAENAT